MKTINELEIYNLFDKGYNFTQIGNMLGICRKKISTIIKKKHIDIDFTNRSKIDVNVFTDITNKDVNYFLGLLATDGCLHSKNRIEISLKESDLQILELYKKFLGGNVNITEKFKTLNGNKFKSYRIAFRSKEIYNKLIDIGITPKKSNNLEIKIPITIDFLRGAIDGDGSFIRSGRINLTSASKKFIIQISDYLDTIDISYTISLVNRKSTIYSLNINRQEHIVKLIDLLYKDTNTFLIRKYYTAQDMRNRICNMRQIRGTSVRNPEPRLDNND